MRENGRVSDAQDSPETPEPPAAAGVDASGELLETQVTSDAVTVRRAPRYGRFIALGAIVGVLVALILTFAFSGRPTGDQFGLGFDKGQVFGFLLLLCGTVGAAVGAAVALLFDRASAGRARSMTAEHESTHRIDD